jgi:dienelactone hydrolase
MTRSLIALIASLAFAATTALADGHSQSIVYTSGDKEFNAYAMSAQSKPKGTVYIIHDWNGLDSYEQKRVGMLAELGYDAVALDLFGVDAKLEGFEDYRRETGALYKDRQEFRSRINAGINAAETFFKSSGKTVLMGYCFGGAAVLEAARSGLDLDGFVSFHGGLTTPEGQDYTQTTGKVLLLHGSADPVSGMEDLASLLNQLQTEEVDHNAEVFGGARHSFTIEGSRDFDAAAERKSWDALLRFLNEDV